MTTAAEQQERTIQEARRLLEPSPVRLHHVPGWFRRRLLATYGCDRGDASAFGVLHHAERRNGWRWLDHYGSTTWRGQTCFVSEPYHITEEDIAAVVKMCRECNLDWEVSPNSWWYPGNTLRILIFEKMEQGQ